MDRVSISPKNCKSVIEEKKSDHGNTIDPLMTCYKYIQYIVGWGIWSRKICHTTNFDQFDIAGEACTKIYPGYILCNVHP